MVLDLLVWVSSVSLRKCIEILIYPRLSIYHYIKFSGKWNNSGQLQLSHASLVQTNLYYRILKLTRGKTNKEGQQQIRKYMVNHNHLTVPVRVVWSMDWALSHELMIVAEGGLYFEGRQLWWPWSLVLPRSSMLSR